ncbi:MAG: hypothetical protein H7835_20210, partial [Magnetococcus sp. XQGC-1]
AEVDASDIASIRSAAFADNAEAQVTLAAMYHYGHVLPHDETLSIAWYLSAATQGHTEAQRVVAIILLQKGDRKQAKFWLYRSAFQGDLYAQQLLHMLNQSPYSEEYQVQQTSGE